MDQMERDWEDPLWMAMEERAHSRPLVQMASRLEGWTLKAASKLVMVRMRAKGEKAHQSMALAPMESHWAEWARKVASEVDMEMVMAMERMGGLWGGLDHRDSLEMTPLNTALGPMENLLVHKMALVWMESQALEANLVLILQTEKVHNLALMADPLADQTRKESSVMIPQTKLDLYMEADQMVIQTPNTLWVLMEDHLEDLTPEGNLVMILQPEEVLNLP